MLIPAKLWQEVFDEVTQLLDDIVESEHSQKESDRESVAKRFKERMFVVVKMMAFAFSESGSDFVVDKFELQFYHVRDELVEAVGGDKATVQAVYHMLTDRGASESSQLLLYLLKKLHWFRQKKRKSRAEK